MAPSPGEYEIQQRIRLACGRGTTRLWRNNTGTLVDRQGWLMRFGLCKGSSDLIGLRSVEVTAAMVGQRIGQFVAIEVKAPHGAIRPEQETICSWCSGSVGSQRSAARSRRPARFSDALPGQGGAVLCPNATA